jgi:uncharacterized protein (DUF1015 family)
MVHIRPFKGLRYSQEKIPDLNLVVTPPYDIITPEEQEAYYQKNRYNIIRLILGKSYPDDTPTYNRYTRAARYLADWVNQGILISDPTPSLYAYRQEYGWKGARITRWGFIGLVRLEEFSKGIILPHEDTLASPKLDRLNLLRTCKANPCPIFGLYSDPKNKINTHLEKYATENPPIIQLIDDKEIEHSLWIISQPELINTICKEMVEKQLIIADGHHRYESALAYQRESHISKSNRNLEGPSDYIMMYLSNLDDQGLTVLPIHRMLRNKREFAWSHFEKRVEQYFVLQPATAPDINLDGFLSLLEKEAGKRGVFGMYTGEKRYYLLQLKDTINPEEVIEEPLPSAWKNLDVTIFQTLLLEKSLNFSFKTLEEQQSIGFTHNAQEAITLVDKKVYKWAFFLKATRVQDIKKVCLSGHKMPQKSTFFYPKLLSGLVLYSFLNFP